MDYIRRLVGIDYIGIGTDFTNGDPLYSHPSSFPIIRVILPRCLLFSPRTRLRPKFQPGKRPPVLRAELVRHGYSSVDIAKILGGNWMRVFREAWNS